MIQRIGFLFIAVAVFSSCTSDVGQKVMYDFGVGEKPEGYVAPTEKIMAALPEVGAIEIQRLNAEARQGEVKFLEEGEFRGKYYKEARVFERAVPLDASAAPRTASERDTRVFYGYIDYAYRIYQGPRRDTRAEADADRAAIATSDTGRETYRYKFGLSGDWDGTRGERIRD